MKLGIIIAHVTEQSHRTGRENSILLGHQESTLSITIVTYGVQTSDILGCCGYV